MSTAALVDKIIIPEILKGAGGLLGTYIGSEYVNDIDSVGETLFSAAGSSYGGIVGGGVEAMNDNCPLHNSKLRKTRIST